MLDMEAKDFAFRWKLDRSIIIIIVVVAAAVTRRLDREILKLDSGEKRKEVSKRSLSLGCPEQLPFFSLLFSMDDINSQGAGRTRTPCLTRT